MHLHSNLPEIIKEVAVGLDSAVTGGASSSSAPEKFRDLVPSTGGGGTSFGLRSIGVAGRHRGRPVSVSLHRGSEMKIIVHCSSPCRFRIVRNTLGARLNILGGRRIHFGISMIDVEYVARNSGSCDLSTFLQRSDIAAFIDFFRPFYSISGMPGTVRSISNFSANTLKAGEVMARLERMIEFTGMLEEAFADEAAMAEIEKDGRE